MFAFSLLPMKGERCTTSAFRTRYVGCRKGQTGEAGGVIWWHVVVSQKWMETSSASVYGRQDTPKVSKHGFQLLLTNQFSLNHYYDPVTGLAGGWKH